MPGRTLKIVSAQSITCGTPGVTFLARAVTLCYSHTLRGVACGSKACTVRWCANLPFPCAPRCAPLFCAPAQALCCSASGYSAEEPEPDVCRWSTDSLAFSLPCDHHSANTQDIVVVTDE